MLSDIEANNLPAVVGKDEHHEQEPEGRRRYYEHVDGSDAERLVAQKATPSWRWGVWPAQHVLGDGRPTDLDAKLEQLTVDARRTPEWVGEAHLTDQFACVRIDGFAPSSGPPTPVEPKALPVPLDHGSRLHQHHRLEAPRPRPIKADPDQPIDGA